MLLFIKMQSQFKMSKKERSGIVYSTNPDFEYENQSENEIFTLPNNEQKIYVSLDKKQRAGKSVTLIEGFVGQAEDLKQLEKKLKNLCGVGGTSKDNVILIQGDFKEKIFLHLQKENYNVKKKG